MGRTIGFDGIEPNAIPASVEFRAAEYAFRNCNERALTAGHLRQFVSILDPTAPMPPLRRPRPGDELVADPDADQNLRRLLDGLADKIGARAAEVEAIEHSN